MSPTKNSYVYVCLLLLSCISCCFGFATFRFDIHHRYSDAVKKMLDVDDLPKKGSFSYCLDLVSHDRFFQSRWFATENNQMSVTFEPRNETYQLGFLYYANVTVGTPGLSFLVALDTGSDLFWLPCNCSTTCVHSVNTSSGMGNYAVSSCLESHSMYVVKQIVNLNIYSPDTSSTSSKVPCNSSQCKQRNQCSSAGGNCPYRVSYVSFNTSSRGYLVEDVLHLITDDNKSTAVDARILLGCGQVQTGLFLKNAAVNGLFGLGVDDVSVPSVLAKQGITSNSFSMCFGPDGLGRISFGDKGSSDQAETPFYLGQIHPTYNIAVTQISVGDNATNLEFSAIFDTGTAFTYLNDPAYTVISESFNSQVQETRFSNSSRIPFEYCYFISSNQTTINPPPVNLTMKGGHQFAVNYPTEVFSSQDTYIYCLAVIKSDVRVNIIGQNFMTGYRIVFDREKNVLGWKPSNCYDA